MKKKLNDSFNDLSLIVFKTKSKWKKIQTNGVVVPGEYTDSDGTIIQQCKNVRMSDMELLDYMLECLVSIQHEAKMRNTEIADKIRLSHKTVVDGVIDSLGHDQQKELASIMKSKKKKQEEVLKASEEKVK